MPKIVRFHETGEADVLRLEELPDSQPGKGEVRLKVAAIGPPTVCCVKPLTPAAHGPYNGDTHPIRSFRRPYPFPLTSVSQPNAWREWIVSWR